jgi:Holliday junction resolvase RusA-like endonuclease
MLPMPKKTNRRYPTTKPDIDKLSRAVLDALTSVWYKDDSQVIQLEAQKIYTYGEPGVYIGIGHLDNNLVTPNGAREQMATRRID